MAETGRGQLPLYSSVLRRACSDRQPLFGRKEYGQIYREAAGDPHWLAISLITNAEREGDGAGRLWSLAACTADYKLSRAVKQHGIDESFHSRAYINILDLIFPNAVDDGLRRQLLGLSPGYREVDQPIPIPDSPYAHEVTIDDLIQMNIAEIRTRVHHLLQRPAVLTFCHDNKKASLTCILDRLLEDETKHVVYTAELIEARARTHPEEVEELFRARLSDFDEITREELGDHIFE